MRRGSRKIFLLALILGTIAASWSWKLIQEKGPEPAPVATVVVATQDIPVRTRITAGLVAVEEIPASAKHPEALSTVGQADGQISRLPITKGEQVLISKFAAAREDSGLSFIIPPSKRAVAVSTNEVIGAGGLVLPGDRVDVIGVFDAKTMGKDMATVILQDIEVLAVAQQLQGDIPDQGLIDRATGAMNGAQPTGASKGTAQAAPKTSPQPQPAAKSVTLAVTPEEAQRLFLADAYGKIRLALRPYQDAARVDLQEATLSSIRSPLQQGAAQITAASISPVTLNAGDVMKVEITVKNVSNATIKSQAPDPGFTYVQGQTFQSQGFASQTGAYRVGLNLSGQRPVEYPYRWGLGGDLPPGASTTVAGYVKFTSAITTTDFWAGLIQEPATIAHDNVGLVHVTVNQTNAVMVTVDSADVRSGPSLSSPMIGQVSYGTQLQLLGQEADWYKVQLPDSNLVGYVAAGWVAAPGKR
ncbi:MAG: Flp pilus assembly protein CpaB [Dehalococcoidia bacterium]|nr:Flp pilus assembly protein CpaB [Dehalococcoidia bacterium]